MWYHATLPAEICWQESFSTRPILANLDRKESRISLRCTLRSASALLRDLLITPVSTLGVETVIAFWVTHTVTTLSTIVDVRFIDLSVGFRFNHAFITVFLACHQCKLAT